MNAYQHSSAPEARASFGASDAASRPTVYVVVPTFNRADVTLRCIDLLKEQTYPNIKIIVADGRSTDGTPERVRAAHADVTVLTPQKELWWGGSARMGVDSVLANGARDSDFLMLMNDDTHFDPDYTEILVEASAAHGAVLSGVVVDEDDTSIILDGGVALEWPRFAFYGIKERKTAGDVFLGSHVLPGRGTLFPVWAVREAGSVDDRWFPHYLSDYEFTYRIKEKTGAPLGIDYRAEIRTKESNPKPKCEDYSAPFSTFVQRFKFRFSRRSKQNIPSSVIFIWRYAPRDIRTELLVSVLTANTRYIFQPIRVWGRESVTGRIVTWPVRAPIATVRWIWRAAFWPYLMTSSDLDKFGLDVNELYEAGLLKNARYAGYLAPTRSMKFVRKNHPDIAPLYSYAKHPGRKVYRAIRARLRSTRILHSLWRAAFWPCLIMPDDVEEFGLNVNELYNEGVLTNSRYVGYLAPTRSMRFIRENYPDVAPLYERARNPWRKLRRGLHAWLRNGQKPAAAGQPDAPNTTRKT